MGKSIEALTDVVAESLTAEGGSLTTHGGYADSLTSTEHGLAGVLADVMHFCARVRTRADLPSVSIKDVYRNQTLRSLAKALTPDAPALLLVGMPVVVGGLVLLLAEVPALNTLMDGDPVALTSWRDALIFSTSLFFGLMIFGLLFVGTVPRLLGSRASAHRLIARTTNVWFFTTLFGDTSYIVNYLRWNRVSPVSIGSNNFIGNWVVYPAHGTTGDNCLPATKVAIAIDGEFRTDTGVLGSNSFEIPRSVQRDTRMAHLERGQQRCAIAANYDAYFWWHERFWKLSVNPKLLDGTPFKNVAWRLPGVEKTLTTVGDGCTGVGSLVHYGVTMGEGAVLAPDSFSMKGEDVPPYARWGGNPAREIDDNRAAVQVGGK